MNTTPSPAPPATPSIAFAAGSPAASARSPLVSCSPAAAQRPEPARQLLAVAAEHDGTVLKRRPRGDERVGHVAGVQLRRRLDVVEQPLGLVAQPGLALR